jgi:hypothetical protein
VTQWEEESRKKAKPRQKREQGVWKQNQKTQEEQPQQETQAQNKAEEEEKSDEEQDTESEHAEKETTESEDKEDEKNKKRYNLRKRKGRTVYVAASKIFRLDNLRDTDDVIKSMKSGYEVSIGGTVSIGGSFFAGSGGSAQMGQQGGKGYQHDDPETDDDKKGTQQKQDQDAHPQQRKQSRMLTKLARYNAPGIKDNENVTGKWNQRNRHQMADECEKKRDRIAQSDMLHKEKTTKNDGRHKGRDVRRRTGINIIEHNNAHIIPSIITGNITNHVKSNVTTLMRKISQRGKLDKNLQDISACNKQDKS